MAESYSTYHYLTMSRSKFDRKVPFKTSLPFGKWAPVGGVFDVLPGSTIKLDLSNVTRMLTPVAPIMDDISMDVLSFYCNWRILFSKTKQFFGENDQLAWTLPQNVHLPHIILTMQNLSGVWTSNAASFAGGHYLYLCEEGTGALAGTPVKLLKSVFQGSLFDYFGLPFVYPNVDVIKQMATKYNTGGQWMDIESIQSIPFRGMQLIYNEFLRNPDINDPIMDLVYDDQDLLFDLDEFTTLYHNKADTSSLTYNFWFLPCAVRWKDLYTALKPAPQRGPAVTLPFSNSAPVKTSNTVQVANNAIPLKMYDPNNTGSTTTFRYMGYEAPLSPSSGPTKVGDQIVKARDTASSDLVTIGGPSNLYADLSNVTMATVNQIRYAFSTQRFYEKLAMSPRYHDYLKIMFGTRPTDGVLQRPQFLGGHHQAINVSQVLQTSQTDSTPLGSTGAYSVTGFKDHVFTNSFDEFGIIINIATIRKQHTYCQGLDKYWTKREITDIYNPTFAHIGHVPCAKNEVYWQPGNSDVLGYNEAWYEDRFGSGAKVTGLLNPLAPNNLASFVLTDVFDTAPTLSDKFVFEDPNGLDRVLVAGADYTNQFICDFYFKYTVSAVMPLYSTPGLIDHF